jgi:hypothetical protein
MAGGLIAEGRSDTPPQHAAQQRCYRGSSGVGYRCGPKVVSWLGSKSFQITRNSKWSPEHTVAV